jgi:hypothetical protein
MLDLWGTLQTKVIRLEAAMMLLAGTTAGLAGLIGWLVTRPMPIYYIPATGAPGLLRSGEVSEALASDVGQQLVLLLGNVTPVTVAAAHQGVEKFLHPTLLLPFRVQAAREREVMATQDISSQLSCTGATAIRGDQQWQIVLSGVRRVYVGALPVRDEDVQAAVTLASVHPSPLNPYGLVVTELRITPALAEAGPAERVAVAGVGGRRRWGGGQP